MQDKNSSDAKKLCGNSSASLSSRRSESGNIFFALFGAVALIGVIGASTIAIMRGPLATMVEVQNRTQAESEMAIASRLSLLEASELAASGDCDADGFVEPLEWTDAAGNGPTGGGFLPPEVSSARLDPWGTEYGYCAWDAGTAIDYVGTGYPDTCDNGGGSSNSTYNRLPGNGSNTDDTYTIVAIISAGANQQFETTCTGGATPDVAKGGDDIVVEYTYESAVTATNGLWNIKPGDPNVAEIDKEIEVGGNIDLNRGGTGTGQLQLGAGSMIYPDQTVLSVCPGVANVNVGLLRMNTGVSPYRLEICDTSGWVSSGGTGVWTAGTGNKIYYNSGTPEVGIGTTTPSHTLEVVGTFDNSGAVTFGSTLDVNGATTLAGLTATGAVDFDTTLNVDGATTLVGTLGVTGASTLTTLNATGAADFDSTLNVDGATTVSTLHGTGAADLDTTLNVDGATTLGDTLDVTGATDLGATLNVDGATTLVGTLDAQDAISNSTGNLALNDDVDITDDLDVNGSVDIDGTLESDEYTWNGNDFTPATCASGSFNRWDGDSWECEDDISGTSGGTSGTSGGIWEIDTGVARIKDSAGNWASDSLVFGSPQMDDDGDADHQARMFFDKATASFRAGADDNSYWDTRGYGSIALGFDAAAPGDMTFATGLLANASGQGAIAIGEQSTSSGDKSVAIGQNSDATNTDALALGANTTASGLYSTAIGSGSTANAQWAFALGNGATASGVISHAFGTNVVASGQYGTAIGMNVRASGQSSMAFSGYNDIAGPYAQVSGTNSFGFFMGSNAGYNLSTANRFGIVGGDFLIDDAGATGSNGCMRYNGTTSRLQFSHDCTTWSDMVSATSIVGGIDTQVQFNDAGTFGGDAGLTYSKSTDTLTVGRAVIITGQAGNAPSFMNLDDLGDVALVASANGECLVYDGTQWENGTCGGATDVTSGIFEIASNVARVKDAAGDWAADDFVFGSPQLADDGDATHDARMFFDKSKGAFRAGAVTGTEWDDASVGAHSFASGSSRASGVSSVALGGGNTASGVESFATGLGALANNNVAFAAGQFVTASGYNSIAHGQDATASGSRAVVFGLGDATGTSPIVSGNSSFGIFMGDQSGYDLTASNRMALVGGHFMIDDAGATGSQGCIRYDGTNSELEYSNDCTTYSAFSSLGSLWTDNTTHITRGNFHVLDAGLAAGSTTAGLDGDGMYSFYDPDKGAMRGGEVTWGYDHWQDTNIGTGSFGWGRAPRASGLYATAFGDRTQATGNNSTALGYDSRAGNSEAFAVGDTAWASGLVSIAMGQEVRATADNSMVIGLADQTNVTDNQVSGQGSLGIFMDDVGTYNLSDTDMLAVVGGQIMIDEDATSAASRGCIRYNDTTDRLQFSHDCTTYSDIGSVAAGVIALNDLSDAMANLATDGNMFIGHEGTSVTAGSGIRNLMIGQTAGDSITTGDENVGIGRGALTSVTTTSDNTAIGNYALYNNVSDENTAIGSGAMRYYSGTTDGNTAVGAYAGPAAAGGLNAAGNTSIGLSALNNTTAGDYNVAVGGSALSSNQAKGQSTAVGYNSMRHMDSTTTEVPSYNSALGYSSLRGATTDATLNTGTGNTAIGHTAIQNITSGNNNTALGYLAGGTISSGSNNIALGYNADFTDGTASNQLNIGNTIYGNLSNKIVGIGSSNNLSAARLVISSEDTNNDVVHYSYGTAIPDYVFFRSRGTEATPTTLATADNIGRLAFFGHDGTSYQGTAAILAQVNGAVSAGAVPTDILLATSASNTASVAERMRIGSGGNVGIGNFSADTIDSTLHLASGDIRLDGGAGNQAGCIRYNDTSDELEYSNDCTTFTALADIGSGTGIFEVTGGAGTELVRQVTANAPYATSDFLFGSSQMADVVGQTWDDARMFFDKSKGAFRVGYAETEWDDANVGNESISLGYGSIASGQQSVAIGSGNVASGQASYVLGISSTASNQWSTALGAFTTSSGGGSLATGYSTIASGDYSTAIGHTTTTSGYNATAFGSTVRVGSGVASDGTNLGTGLGDYSMGLGLGLAAGTAPQITGDSSLGIFMGDQSGINLASDLTMAVMGGDFIVGSYQLDDTTTGNQDRRLFFDVSKGALRSGYATGDHFNDANVGAYSAAFGERNRSAGQSSFAAGRGNTTSAIESIALGADNTASAQYSIAMGYAATASGYQSLAWGWGSNASGNTAVVIGGSSTAAGDASIVLGGGNSAAATGDYSMIMGFDNVAGGLNSVLLGRKVTTTAAADHSAALGLGNPAGANPQVSGDNSYGIFMGDQSGYDLTANNRMALVGGHFMIDDVGATGSQGCFRYDGTNSRMQFSHDCTTYSDLGSVASGTIAINDLSDGLTDYANNNLYLGSGTGGSNGVIANYEINMGVGIGALANIGTGCAAAASWQCQYNVALGFEALNDATTATSNIAIGYRALDNATADVGNTAIGESTLGSLSGSNYHNTVLGARSATALTSGGYNVMVGTDVASTAFTSGSDNVFLGEGSANSLTTGSRNIFIGKDTGDDQTSGNDNILIGENEQLASLTGSNQLNIGGTIYGDLSTDQVAIGTATQTADAQFKVAGTGSIMIPGGTNAQRPGTGAAGMFRYNTDATPADTLEYYDLEGATWRTLIASGAGAVSAIDDLSDGVANNANIFLGGLAGNSNSGDHNTGVGRETLYSNTTGTRNTAVGSNTMYGNLDGGYNTALGVAAMYSSSTGDNNSVLGYRIMFSGSNGNDNTISGYQAAYTLDGDYNVIMGSGAGYAATDADNNVFLGYQTGDTTTTGDGNILIGASLDASSATASNELNIGGTIYGDLSTDQVAIGTATQTADAQFKVAGTGSIMIPGGTNAQRPATGAAGMVRYNSDATPNDKVEYYDAESAAWVQLAGGSAGAINDLSDAYTDYATGFNMYLGDSAGTTATTPQYNIAMGQNALNSLDNTCSNWDECNYNVALGYNALTANTTGNNNVAIGYESLAGLTTTQGNIAIGRSALAVNNTDYSIAIGMNALSSNTTGNRNIAIGRDALASNVGGGYNVAIGDGAGGGVNVNFRTAIGNGALASGGEEGTAVGYRALNANTGSYNSALGKTALENNTTGYGNTAMGFEALDANIDGSNNAAFGSGSMGANIDGGGNAALGAGALGGNTSGGDNVGIGYQAGDNITTGARNIIIGRGVDAPSATGSDQLNIGNTIYSDMATDRVAIGTDTQTASIQLKVAGTGGVMIPAGTNAQRPATGAAGMVRYNSDATPNDKVEYYDAESAAWVQLAGATSDLWTDNTTHISRAGVHVLNAAETSDSTDMSIAGGGSAGRRMFFDMTKGSIRGGEIEAANDAWDDVNITDNSFAWGLNAQASDGGMLAIGSNVTATTGAFAIGGDITASQGSIVLGGAMDAYGLGAVAIGNNATSGGNSSIAIGSYVYATAGNAIAMGISADAQSASATAIGNDIWIGNASPNATAIGHTLRANAEDAVVLGETARVNGENSMAIGLGEAAGTEPIVSAANSFGIFMGDQSGYDIATANRMGIVGGHLMIDDAAAGSQGCIRYVQGTGLQFSHDCTTYTTMGGVAAGAVAINDLSDAMTDHVTDHNLVLGHEGTVLAASTGTYNMLIGATAGDSLTTGGGNIAIGDNALTATTDGNSNIAIGRYVLQGNVSGAGNTSIGYDSMSASNTGDYNTAMGINALNANTSGALNTAIGTSALIGNTTGERNTGIGAGAMMATTTGGFNTALGYYALHSNVDDEESTAIGYQAMRYADDDSTGGVTYNTAVGAYSLLGSTTAADNTGTSNTAIGHSTLLSVTSGSNNIAVGDRAADNITTGSSNITIGSNIDAVSATASNQLNIGNTIYGDLSTDRIGIGTSSPASELHVVGDIRFTGVLIDISDQRLKTDIHPLVEKGSVLARLKDINGYSFRMKDDKEGEIEYGVMAQEIERVFPELVQTADDEIKTKSVNYLGLIAPIIEATKELEQENKSLKAEIAKRDARMDALEARMASFEGDMLGIKRHTGYEISKASLGFGAILALLGSLGIIFIIRRRGAE